MTVAYVAKLENAFTHYLYMLKEYKKDNPALTPPSGRRMSDTSANKAVSVGVYKA